MTHPLRILLAIAIAAQFFLIARASAQTPVLQSITVAPADVSLPAGTKQQYTATGQYTDGSTQDLTSSASWVSSAIAVATIDAAGLATASAAGTTTISANVSSVTGQTGLTVTPPVLQSITISPSNPSLPKGTTLQFTATGHYSDASTTDLTSSVTWASSDATVATINSGGLATGVAEGTSTINASLNTTTGATLLTVTPPVLQFIVLAPANSSVQVGFTVQYTATGQYSDNTAKNLTSLARWSSSNTAAATISSTGLATGVAPGSTNISARYKGVRGATVLAVTPVLQSITVTPANGSVAAGLTLQFKATGTYSDNTAADLTTSVIWASSNTAAATISTAGLATGVASGASTISARYNTVTGSTGLTVTAPVLQSIVVTPANASIAVSATRQFTATGHYSDSTTNDLTSVATWSSSNTAAATISTAGLAMGVAGGATTISARYNTVTGSTGLTVTAPVLQSIVVRPATASIGVGLTCQFTATGYYTDASTQDLTTAVSWGSKTNAVATISNTSGTQGQAAGVSLGATTITATSGSIVGSSGLTVISLPVAIAPQFTSMSLFAANFGPTTLPGNYWPTVSFGSLRLWDTHTGWPDLEPSQGVYRWDMLNGWLNLAQSHGLTDILYTFGSTASWASSNPTDPNCKYGPGTCDPPVDLDQSGAGTDQMWIDFVTQLATVGKGRIKYYQLWDTPQDPTHWTGSVEQLLRMSKDAYNTIKSIDPNAKIVSPPSGAYKAAPSKCVIANRSLPFFSKGGGQWVDIISFNTYYDNLAEDIIPVMQCFMENVLVPYGQIGKPLWASEGGWGTSTDLTSETLQAAFLARSYLILLSQGARRFYWYAWNNPNWGTLWNKNTGIRLPGTAYAQVRSWLVGRTLTQPCATDANQVWTCVVTGANGFKAQATWVQGVSRSYTPPSEYVNYRDLLGGKTLMTSGQPITISSSPILLQNQ
jgi:uncharacterized protein YjdB